MQYLEQNSMQINNQPTQSVIGCQYAMVAGQIDPGFWHEGCQSGNEVHWIESHLGGAIPVGGLEDSLQTLYATKPF